MEPVVCRLRWATVDTRTASLSALLTPAEQERAEGMRDTLTRHEFILARVTARRLVAEHWDTPASRVVFHAVCRRCAGPHGRLEAPTRHGVVHVSVSHSAGRVAVAAALGVRVGVDVERVALRGAGPPVTALSPVERQVLVGLPARRRTEAFVRYWTRKEAVLKATGDGLARTPADLTVSAPDAPPRVLDWADRPAPHTALHLSDVDAAPGFLAALATMARPHTVVPTDEEAT